MGAEGYAEMYTVLVSDGSGEQHTLRFKYVADALRYADSYTGEGSIALRKPDGTFYTWADGRVVVENRRRYQRWPTRTSCVIRFAPGYLDSERLVATSRLATVVDAGQGGVRVRFGGEHVPVQRDGLVTLGLASAGTCLRLPARVAWVEGQRLGLWLAALNSEARDQYTRWLEATVRNALAVRVSRHAG